MTPRLGTAGRIAATAMLAGGIVFGGAFSAASALEPDQAEVRVLHNSPDAPAVDVFVNGDRAIENLAFGEDTGLVPLPAGVVTAAVAPAGAPESDAVISADLTLEPCMSYEVAAVGDLKNIEAQVYPIDTSAITDGKARVRAIHNSPDAPAVDVAVKDGPVLFSNLAFPNASEYAEVDAGTYDLEIRPAGTEDVALAVPGVTLEPNTIYDVFAIGNLADGSLTAKPVTATPEPCATPAAAGSEATPAAASGSTTGTEAAPVEGSAGTTGTEAPAVGGADTTMTQMPTAGVGSMAENPFALWALIAAVGAAVGGVAVARRARAA